MNLKCFEPSTAGWRVPRRGLESLPLRQLSDHAITVTIKPAASQGYVLT